MEVAAEMDRSYRANPASAGPLHCIPIILKDNFNTFDMPTTGGNVSMKISVPPSDAFTVARMRKAGALILAKANLQEFARGGMSISSLGGQVRNPYDLSRTPGGSSGGPGAAIDANFAVLGTGSDTGQSIRSAASANNLVGMPYARSREQGRGHSKQPDAGRSRPDRAHGDGRSATARRDGRLRPGRSHHRFW
jgi:amidase